MYHSRGAIFLRPPWACRYAATWATVEQKNGMLRMVGRELGKAVVVVSHDHRTREVADRVLWLEDGRFRAAVKMENDPVCGALVETEGSPSVTHAGRTFYFCAQECRRRFQDSPARFVALADAVDRSV